MLQPFTPLVRGISDYGVSPIESVGLISGTDQYSFNLIRADTEIELTTRDIPGTRSNPNGNVRS